jgi:MSHA pilin protein MshD
MSRDRGPSSFRHRGTTLVELVISIAIIGIAVVGVLQVMTMTTMHGADPMVREQAQLIAESYMEEILLKRFADPTMNTVCPAAPALRTNYDNVCDYNGLNDSGARDQFGTAIVALASYTVTVTVTTVGVALGNIDNTVPFSPNLIRVLRVLVTVTGPGDTSVPLTGYRTDYDCNWATGVNCTI